MKPEDLVPQNLGPLPCPSCERLRKDYMQQTASDREERDRLRQRIYDLEASLKAEVERSARSESDANETAKEAMYLREELTRMKARISNEMEPTREHLALAYHYGSPPIVAQVEAAATVLASKGEATVAFWLRDMQNLSSNYIKLQSYVPGLSAEIDACRYFVGLVRGLLEEHDAANGSVTGAKQPDSPITKRIRQGLALMPDRPEYRPFCVCGRPMAQCDGSRKDGVSRHTPEGAF